MLRLVSVFATLLTLSGAFGKNCPATNTYLPNMLSLDAANRYPIADSRLHIFPQLAIPCDGFLTNWRFLTRTHTIKGLHLAVFRPTAPTRYDLVAATFIHDYGAPGTDSGSWVTFKTQPPIIVQEGDVLGFFYEDMALPETQLTILTRDTEAENPEPYTLLLEKSAFEIKSSISVDVSDAMRDNQFPALIAVFRAEPHSPRSRSTTKRMPMGLSFLEDRNELPPALFFGPTMSSEQTQRPTQLPSKCLNPPVQSQFCTDLSLRSFFDFSKAECRSFFGCPSMDEDANNFLSMGDCRQRCIEVNNPVYHDPPLLPVPVQMLQLRDAVCDVVSPSNAMYCYEPTVRYYFDSISNACYSYYGCPSPKGGGNNFNSRDECRYRCMGAGYWAPPSQKTTTTTTQSPPPLFFSQPSPEPTLVYPTSRSEAPLIWRQAAADQNSNNELGANNNINNNNIGMGGFFNNFFPQLPKPVFPIGGPFFGQFQQPFGSQFFGGAGDNQPVQLPMAQAVPADGSNNGAQMSRYNNQPQGGNSFWNSFFGNDFFQRVPGYSNNNGASNQQPQGLFGGRGLFSNGLFG